MRTLVITRSGWMTLLSFVMCVCSTVGRAQQMPASAWRQPASNTVLKKRLKIDMPHAHWEDLIKTIAKQANINIIADGMPLEQSVDFTLTGTLQEILDALADKFDYTWKTASADVIIMNKRFQDGRERPQAHYAEIKQVVKDVLDGLNALPHDPHAEEVYQTGNFVPRWPQMIKTLIKDLSPQQMAALQQGQRLSMTDFSPDQRGLLINAIYDNGFFSTRGQWYGLMSLLKELPRSYLHTSKISDSNYGYGFVDRDKKYIPTAVSIFATTITFSSP